MLLSNKGTKMHILKKYLKENGIKVTYFAKLIKITQPMLYNYFTYKCIPKLETAQKISELTGIPVIDLLYPEERNGNGNS